MDEIEKPWAQYTKGSMWFVTDDDTLLQMPIEDGPSLIRYEAMHLPVNCELEVVDVVDTGEVREIRFVVTDGTGDVGRLWPVDIDTDENLVYPKAGIVERM